LKNRERTDGDCEWGQLVQRSYMQTGKKRRNREKGGEKKEGVSAKQGATT